MSPPRAAVPIDLETNRQVSMALDYRFLVADTGRVVSTNYTEGGAFLSLRALDPDGTTKAITTPFRSIRSFDISADGRRIVLSGQPNFSTPAGVYLIDVPL